MASLQATSLTMKGLVGGHSLSEGWHTRQTIAVDGANDLS